MYILHQLSIQVARRDRTLNISYVIPSGILFTKATTFGRGIVRTTFDRGTLYSLRSFTYPSRGLDAIDMYAEPRFPTYQIKILCTWTRSYVTNKATESLSTTKHKQTLKNKTNKQKKKKILITENIYVTLKLEITNMLIIRVSPLHVQIKYVTAF